MFTGQTGANRREDSSNEGEQSFYCGTGWYSSVQLQVNLADIRIGFQGRQFGGRIWKIWFHLSICIWPSNVSISFRCYVGKEIVWWMSGCSNLGVIWFYSRANAVGQSCCISFLQCTVAIARFSCSSISEFLKKYCWKVLNIFGLKKALPIPVSIPTGKSMGHTSTSTKKYCQYFIAHTFFIQY